MNVESFLNFIMKHNATIIEVLVGMTLLVILFLAIRSFLYAKDEPQGASTNMAEIEESLKKILEKANQVPSVAAASAVTAGGGAVDSTPLLAEITKLKTDLEAKQKKIEELSAASAAGAPAAATGAGISSDEKEKLDNQIKELQAKLSEYEIISEDIADLSFYKEQNARLQKELAEAKGGAPAAAAATPAPAAPAAPVAEAAPPVPPTPEPAAATPPPPPPAPPEPSSVIPEVAAIPIENTVDADLMAEFEAAVQQQQKEEKRSDLGSLNMDKMMAEAAQIKTDVPEIKAEDVLNQSLDENKLLQEANAMKTENSEDKKLMGQFEDFVKKGES